MSTLHTDIPETWSTSVTTSSAEIWQCRFGTVLLSDSDSGLEDRGIRLRAGDAVQIASGATLYYRREGGSTAVIAREAI